MTDLSDMVGNVFNMKIEQGTISPFAPSVQIQDFENMFWSTSDFHLRLRLSQNHEGLTSDDFKAKFQVMLKSRIWLENWIGEIVPSSMFILKTFPTISDMSLTPRYIHDTSIFKKFEKKAPKGSIGLPNQNESFLKHF